MNAPPLKIANPIPSNFGGSAANQAQLINQAQHINQAQQIPCPKEGEQGNSAVQQSSAVQQRNSAVQQRNRASAAVLLEVSTQ